jgi:hypothetical protein
MDIVILLFGFHFELVKAKADPSLRSAKSLGRED